MLYNIIYEYKDKDGNQKDQSILFNSKELLDDFIDWIKGRVDLAKDQNIDQYIVYNGTNDTAFKLTIDSDVECVGYTDASIIYSVDISTKTGFITRVGFFNNLDSAQNLKNIITHNLTKYKCRMCHNIVIRDKDDLNTYTLFLSSHYGSIIDNLFTFPSVKEI